MRFATSRRENAVADRESTVPEPLSTRVCLALAAERGVHPWKSPPLYETIEPTALDALGAQQSPEWRLEFEVDGHVVAVTGDEEIAVDGNSITERDLADVLDGLDRPRSFQRTVE